MKLRILLPGFVVLTMTALSLHSQTAEPAAPPSLAAIKAGNEAILAKQKKTLETLAGMKETAQQLKIFTKRG